MAVFKASKRSGVESAASQVSSSPRVGLPRRAAYLVIPAAVVVLSTIGAWVQAPRPDAYRDPAPLSWQWWRYPVEWNAFKRLPAVAGHLHAVSVAPGTRKVWAVGSGGFIVHSPDGGETWTPQPVATFAQGSATPPPDIRSESLSPREAEAAVIVAQGGGTNVGPTQAPVNPRAPGSRAPTGAANPTQAPLRPEAPGSPTPTRPPSPSANPTQAPVGREATSPPSAPTGLTVEDPGESSTSKTPSQVPAPQPPPTVRPTPPAPRPQPPPALHAVHFVDEERGWVVGARGTILRTTDGGRTWEQRPSRTTAPLVTVRFTADGRLGWVLGANGGVLQTTDGGATWGPSARLARTPSRAMHVIPDGRRAWIVGDDGLILRTTDGGDTWLQAQSGTSESLRAVHFRGDGAEGWAVGGAGIVLRTTDGGVRWEPRSIGSRHRLTGVYAASDGSTWLVGEDTFLTSRDAGATWTTPSTEPVGSLSAVCGALDGLEGWAVGHSGVILKIDDAGSTWRRLTQPGDLVSTHGSDDASHGWAVARDGTILRTEDNGVTWRGQVSGPPVSLASVHSTPDGRGAWVVGDRGLIRRTTDGGRTWGQGMISPPSQWGDSRPPLRAVHGSADGRRGWVAALDGTVLSTENGGETWQVHTTAALVLLAAHGSRDALRGWVLGPDGAVLRTENGGATWRRQALASSIGYFDIHGAGDGQRAWIVGPGVILRTEDGGATWRAQLPDGRAGVRAIRSSQDGVRGWALGSNGAVLRTEDGGAAWQSQPSGTRESLRAAHMSADGGRGWVVGSAGTILTTLDGGRTWAPITPRVALPPWYWASLAFAGLLILPALWPPKPVVTERGVKDVLVSDRPIEAGEPDPLDFGAIALGLSRFLRNENTKPPLTIAVTGPWGSGKSSLMNLLRADLRPFGFRPVWFNAWHHQKEEHLLAALLENIRAQAIPQWWLPEGVQYRAALLWQRGRRKWPIILPLLSIFAFSAGYFWVDPARRLDEGAWFIGRAAERVRGLVPSVLLNEGASKDKAGPKEEREKTAGAGKTDGATPPAKSEGEPPRPRSEDSTVPPLTAFLLSLTGAIGIGVSVWRGIKGFGVSPASLLASVSGSARVRDLEAQTSFRHRFAREFRDVTDALEPRTMLILIDDLDRCRPENVLEVLEAVNFLVSSGDCYVVMGMELERVRRCVGLGFKDVAEELTDPPVVRPGAPASANGNPDRSRERRAAFAQQYLEKLVNIEVPVPAATLEQAARLVAPAPEREIETGGLWQQVQTVGRVLRSWTPALIVAAVIAAGFWYGWHAPSPSREPATEIVRAAPGSESPGGSATAPGLGDGRIGEDGSDEPGRFVPAAPGRKLVWPLVWPLALLPLVGLWVLLTRPPVIVEDSDEFADALRTWHPLVYSKSPTPRSMKKFLNRVRYYAMRQRPLTPELSRWAGFVPAVRRALGRQAPEAATSRIAPADHIPEDALVALSAIEHGWPELLGQARLDGAGETLAAPATLSAEVRQHVDALAGDPHFATYRQAFAKLSAGVRV